MSGGANERPTSPVTSGRPVQPVRLGMVGGGSDAFIGSVHRMAARLDGRFELVAGALSSTPERARRSGAELGLSPERVYDTFEQMAEQEAARDDGVEAVSIVTPNHLHCAAACAFLERGVHVICDKPLASTLEDARIMAQAVACSPARFFLTHNYSGYPMVRHARDMVAAGALGRLRIVQIEYAQDWLTEPVEASGQKQAGWRMDPAQAGAGGSIGDIGTHAYHLAAFVVGETPSHLLADLSAFVEGRQLDDNAHILLRYADGMRGMLWSSQIAPGHENSLRLRVIGSEATLEFAQEDPNVLWFSPFGGARQRLTRNGPGATEANIAGSRIPAGHPEGYLEGFANIYRDAANVIVAARTGEAVSHSVPGIEAGLEGMAFIDACVRSSGKNGVWVAV